MNFQFVQRNYIINEFGLPLSPLCPPWLRLLSSCARTLSRRDHSRPPHHLYNLPPNRQRRSRRRRRHVQHVQKSFPRDEAEIVHQRSVRRHRLRPHARPARRHVLHPHLRHQALARAHEFPLRPAPPDLRQPILPMSLRPSPGTPNTRSLPWSRPNQNRSAGIPLCGRPAPRLAPHPHSRESAA